MSLSLFACLALAACEGGGSTPAAVGPTNSPTTQTQSVALSTASTTPVSAQVAGISVTGTIPAASSATTLAVTFSTDAPAGAPPLAATSVGTALAYLCVTPSATVSIAALPTFTFSDPGAPSADNTGYLAIYPTAGGTWNNIAGPIAFSNTSPGTYTAYNTLGDTTLRLVAGQTSCFGFYAQALSQFGTTTGALREARPRRVRVLA